MSAPDITELTFALTSSPEKLVFDDERPCAYCNPDHRVEERTAEAKKKHPGKNLPDDVGIVHADYIFRFGHEDGAGVEVPVCDMCIDGAPVEFGDSTAHEDMRYEYGGDGKVVEPVVEEGEDGMEIHRRVPVNGD